MWETPSCTLIILLMCLMKLGEIRAQCDAPTVDGNRILTEDQGKTTYADGTVLTYKCSTGYVPVQSSSLKTITCEGKQWTELQLECKLKSCGNPGQLTNGRYLTPNGVEFGATATAQCDEGYMVVGQNSRNCRETGWDGRPLVCEAVKCPKPSDIKNGNFAPYNEVYDYGEAITYSCDKDYTLVGESTISCLDNGSFPSSPQCKIISCDRPTISNAQRIEGKSPPYKHLEFVRYKCNEGFTMKGQDLLICGVDGWKPPPPVCLAKPGPNPDPTKPGPSPDPKDPNPSPSPKPQYHVIVIVIVVVVGLVILVVVLVIYVKKRSSWGKVPTRNEGRA